MAHYEQIFTLRLNVFKSCLQQMRQKPSVCGKWLNLSHNKSAADLLTFKHLDKNIEKLRLY